MLPALSLVVDVVLPPVLQGLVTLVVLPVGMKKFPSHPYLEMKVINVLVTPGIQPHILKQILLLRPVLFLNGLQTQTPKLPDFHVGALALEPHKTFEDHHVYGPSLGVEADASGVSFKITLSQGVISLRL